MAENIEKNPIDTKLLSDAIIELNISRRNVSIYPRNHPAVDKSLSRAFELMEKLLELRPEITLAVAKDILIFDDCYLEKKHPVYREFALNLSNLNIAYVTFIKGLTKEELYKFHRFICAKVSDALEATLEEMIGELNLIHIRVGFIDYGAFEFDEGGRLQGPLNEKLWERYVYGMLKGTLQSDVISEDITKISPELIARFFNTSTSDILSQESYDRINASYFRSFSGSPSSKRNLGWLLDLINGLNPDIKKEFLSSTIRTVAKDMDTAYKALKGIPVEEVTELLSIINRQDITLPIALKNLLDKLSNLPEDGTKKVKLGDRTLVDDIFLSPDIVSLLEEGDFKSYVDDSYRLDIQKLLDFKADPASAALIKDIEREYTDDIIEKYFNWMALELMSLNIVTEEEYRSLISIMKDQASQFIWTGQYGQILTILHVLNANAEKNIFPDITLEVLKSYYSEEFIGNIIESFEVFGRQMREEAWMLCEYYGDRIISPLMDALINHDSQIIRRLFISILKQFGNRIIPEAIKRLGDSRWFVKRNMLYILSDCDIEAVLPYIRIYCDHENRKVSLEAVKCLLNAGDSFGIEALRNYLRSKSRETVMQGITLAGNYRIKELVPELMQMLKKQRIGGTDMYEKISVVKALGEIGDPRALDALRVLISEKRLFFKAAAERLKEEAYRTLKHYPSQDIRDIIDAGLKSKNEFIRAESVRLKKTLGD